MPPIPAELHGPKDGTKVSAALLPRCRGHRSARPLLNAAGLPGAAPPAHPPAARQVLWVDPLTGLKTLQHDIAIDRGMSFEVRAAGAAGGALTSHSGGSLAKRRSAASVSGAGTRPMHPCCHIPSRAPLPRRWALLPCLPAPQAPLPSHLALACFCCRPPAPGWSTSAPAPRTVQASGCARSVAGGRWLPGPC